jgi:uncharacterized membrane protein
MRVTVMFMLLPMKRYLKGLLQFVRQVSLVSLTYYGTSVWVIPFIKSFERHYHSCLLSIFTMRLVSLKNMLIALFFIVS